MYGTRKPSSRAAAASPQVSSRLRQPGPSAPPSSASSSCRSSSSSSMRGMGGLAGGGFAGCDNAGHGRGESSAGFARGAVGQCPVLQPEFRRMPDPRRSALLDRRARSACGGAAGQPAHAWPGGQLGSACCGSSAATRFRRTRCMHRAATPFAPFALPTSDTPRASIVIPVYRRVRAHPGLPARDRRAPARRRPSR